MNNAVCPSDEQLLPLLAGETVEASIGEHFKECPSCRRRLDLFRSDLDALRAVSVKMPPVAAEPRPSRIGKYLIVGALDTGGQATVYRAIHPTLDKELAIKLSRHAVGRLSDHRSLLVAEGKLLARLEHPGLARIYDLDFHDDLPFLAMEYVRGPNLRTYAADGAVSPQRAAGIVADVGRALEVVHGHGIVHQDIKPQNILIDEHNRPRLIDFGMARLRHAWDESGESPSGGTPAFMSPEQARGEEAAIGPRSDIFALGGVLYYLLTSRPPFQASSVAETLALARQCAFDREALNRSAIPNRLREICLKAMSANPADRYARVEEMVAALDRFQNRPRQLARMGLATLAALLALAIGTGLWSRQHLPQVTIVHQTEAPPPPLEILIFRNGQSFDLPAALPLSPGSDLLQVVARIPRGDRAMMLHINGKGQIQELGFRESQAEGYTKLIYPPEEGKLGTFDPWPGTEAVLVYAAKDQDALSDLDQLTHSLLGNLPALPSKAKIWLGPDETYHLSRSFGDPQVDPVPFVEAKLNDLRERLRGRGLSVIRGLVYSREARKP